MSLKETLSPALARTLTIVGGVLAIIAALLPWVTFTLNDGAYPDKATLQFFDAPFAVSGFRLHTLLLGIAVLVVVFTPLKVRNRVQRALGWGLLGVAIINTLFILFGGGGLGAITAIDGKYAFGGIVAIVAGVLIVVSANAGEIEPIPHWDTKVHFLVAYAVLVVAFVGLLLIVAMMLNAGGQGGVGNPYAGPIFLSLLGFLAGALGALHGIGLTGWISRLSDEHKWFSIIVLLACALALPFTEAGTDYWMTTAANIGVYAATAIGLNIVVGLAGLLDLGYVAFLGIGAFVAANFSGAVTSKLGIEGELPFIVAAIIAAVVAGIFGAVVGSPTLRVRGDYLAIVTLAFGEIFKKSAQNDIGGLTGGANAIPGVPPLSAFGKGFDDSLTIGAVKLPSGVLYYVLIVVLVALVMVVFANLKNSRIGRAWIAIREDEDAARAMGIKTGQAKILAFLIGATLAGVAGAVFAHKTSTVAYDSFQFIESVTLLAAVILGGMGSIPGAVLGAALLLVLPEKLREFSDYRLILFGFALVLIMRFRPQGLVPDRHRRAELANEGAEGRPIEELNVPDDTPGGAKAEVAR
ncbi:branched-chain amino acid transport system permease protein [Actinokineospora alba]|uniref:Branched-chain amino acid transport system permease protein n=1 Tax=Actinokineospora alba TaxID=504798 RepID=A0A1H0WMK6_9PSEU|nr:branched-chain amino acid ABC transporter permease [Actinokineospora alba]TDP67162.1 branched-chain amino acid transport system permease protein [Actinokineospora alba]SDJ53577.1 branched-chain amino acid transport system permease protein [Actinokineospora alba]SDP91949.1 branched-chain amino acid transport system permease protein [Actinokineospora alba]